MIKATTFRINKKKDWFSHETGLVSVHGEVFKGRSRNSTTFKMELFPTISNRVYSDRVYSSSRSEDTAQECINIDMIKLIKDEIVFLRGELSRGLKSNQKTIEVLLE